MKYKSGDKVRIKKDLTAGKSYRMFVNGDMPKWAGEEVEICDVNANSYRLKGIPYNWTDDMLEDLPKIELFDLNPVLQGGLLGIQKALDDFRIVLQESIAQDTESTTFTWEDFKARKLCVNCKGNENIVAFLKECDEQGISFSSGDYSESSLVDWYIDKIHHQYQGEICFIYRSDYVGGLAHDGKQFFKEEGFKVVEYAKQVKTLENCTDAELVAELLKRHTK